MRQTDPSLVKLLNFSFTKLCDSAGLLIGTWGFQVYIKCIEYFLDSYNFRTRLILSTWAGYPPRTTSLQPLVLTFALALTHAKFISPSPGELSPRRELLRSYCCTLRSCRTIQSPFGGGMTFPLVRLTFRSQRLSASHRLTPPSVRSLSVSPLPSHGSFWRVRLSKRKWKENGGYRNRKWAKSSHWVW